MKDSKLIPTLLSIASIAVGWQLISNQIGYPALFPTVIDLLKQIFTLFLSESFFIALFATILRGIIGFSFAFTLAFVLAWVATFSHFWKAFFNPMLVFTRSIPVISLVLLALLWFSPAYLPVFIAMITMFPILYQNILTGLTQTDKRLLEMASVFGKSKSNRFFHIYLPSAKNNIFDGIKTAMGFGWRAIIIGEVLSQPLHGIGTSMKQAQVYIDVPELIAWTAVAIAVSYLFEFIIGQIQRFNIPKHIWKMSNLETILTIQNTKIKEIKITNLRKKFNQISVLENLSISLNSDKVYCLKGPSGVGKTTLLRILSGLEKADTGNISISGNLSFAYVFQDVRLLPWLTVVQNINYMFDRKIMNKQEINSLMNYLLRRTDLTEHADKYPHELSGGQQQRVGLVRALVAKSDVLLLDEPLNGLDNELKIKIMTLISDWILQFKPLVIWATHENIRYNAFEIEEIMLSSLK